MAQSFDSSEESSVSASKTHKIHKSRPSYLNMNFVKLTPSFGDFESDTKKNDRLYTFFKDELNRYYREQIESEEISALKSLIAQPVPSFKEVLLSRVSSKSASMKGVLEETAKYCELVALVHQQPGKKKAVICSQGRHYVGRFGMQVNNSLPTISKSNLLLSRNEIHQTASQIQTHKLTSQIQLDPNSMIQQVEEESKNSSSQTPANVNSGQSRTFRSNEEQSIRTINHSQQKYPLQHNGFSQQSSEKPAYFLEQAIQITAQEAELLSQRHKFMSELRKKQQAYNGIRNNSKPIERLSQLSSQLAFVYQLLKKTDIQLFNEIQGILEKAKYQCNEKYGSKLSDDLEMPEMKYMKLLICKNIRKALQADQVDYLNFFQCQDLKETLGTSQLTRNFQKRDFSQYIRKKRQKKNKKPRTVLKTACAGCFSFHYEQYNPLLHCSECFIRFHKYCYSSKSPIGQVICQSCSIRGNSNRARANECIYCPLKGLIFQPIDESLNAHIFCMILNGVWYHDGIQVRHHSPEIKVDQAHQCTICTKASSYTYHCVDCDKWAHPACAFMRGWHLEINDNGSIKTLKCGTKRANQRNIAIEKSRKYVLNYKKCVFGQIDPKNND